MTWLSQEWHKIIIALLALERLADWIYRLWKRFKPIEEFVERRIHERRHITMTDPLEYLIGEVEMLLAKLHALKPQVEQTMVDGQQIQKDVKEGMADLPITPPPAV